MSVLDCDCIPGVVVAPGLDVAHLDSEENIDDVLDNFIIGESWKDILYPILKSAEGQRVLKKTLDCYRSGQHYITPSIENIFEWTKYTSPEEIRVIIIGQDPYPTKGHAHGLAFSTKAPLVPPSLKNIFKELRNTYPDFKAPSTGDLTGWAKQGVLLLNSVLTFSTEKIYSPSVTWKPVVLNVLQKLDVINPKLVWMRWGTFARTIYTPKSKGALVLNAPHPSPRNFDKTFVGCNHFALANQHLKKHHIPEIDWCNTKNGQKKI